jgi:hypothetical protein
MALKQFSGNYIPEIDRLIFKINTTDDQEFQFLLTRRITTKILSGSESQAKKIIAKKHPGSATTDLLKFKQEHIKKLSQTNEKFENGSQKPLGIRPVLVINVEFVSNLEGKKKNSVMTLTTKTHGIIQIQLPESSLHAIQQLLFQLQEIANWNITQKNNPLGETVSSSNNQVH